MKVKSLLTKIMIGLFCLIFPLTLVGCGEDDTPLSFSELSSVLLEFDTAVRPFLSSVEYNYTEAEDKELLSGASSSITTLSFEMGESFKSLNSVLNELEANESETTEVELSTDTIIIKTGTLNFTAKLSEDKTNMSVICINGKQEYVYELIKRDDGGYFAQIATKNNDAKTFQVYQVSFVGTNGTLNIDQEAERYVSIYNADIKVDNFPSISKKIFKN